MKPALTLVVSAKFLVFTANMGEGFCFYMGDIFLQGRWWGWAADQLKIHLATSEILVTDGFRNFASCILRILQ